jgi:hypothetical protein
MERSASLLHPRSALVIALGSSSPTLPIARISQYETSKPLCNRLDYACCRRHVKTDPVSEPAMLMVAL